MFNKNYLTKKKSYERNFEILLYFVNHIFYENVEFIIFDKTLTQSPDKNLKEDSILSSNFYELYKKNFSLYFSFIGFV